MEIMNVGKPDEQIQSNEMMSKNACNALRESSIFASLN